MSRPNFNDEHFVISYELLKLFQWLLMHEQETLKKLVAKALEQGLKYELDAQAPVDTIQPELISETEPITPELQESIIDFFTVLEMLLHESLSEDQTNTFLQRNMIPAIYHIDTNACDSTSVALSVEKATAAVRNKTGENPKEVLCKELLKRWKPSKKPYAH